MLKYYMLNLPKTKLKLFLEQKTDIEQVTMRGVSMDDIKEETTNNISWGTPSIKSPMSLIPMS